MISLLQLCLGNVVGSACLAVPAFLVSRLGRNPHLSRGLWLLVLLKLVAPPVVPLWWPTNEREATHSQPDNLTSHSQSNNLIHVDLAALLPPSVAVEYAEPEPMSVPWAEAVGAIWLTGSVAVLVLTVRRVVRFDRLVSETASASEAYQVEARRLAAELGIVAVPEVRLVEGCLPPLLWQFQGRALILLPVELLARLDRSGVSSILAHELVHLRRRDHWLRRFELLVLTLYWWLPLAWWARRELRAAEEQCCDSAAVGRWPERAPAYAQALWLAIDSLAERPAAVPGLASGFGYGASLQRRFSMLTRYDIPTHLNRVSWIVLATAGLLVLPATAQQPAIETPPVEGNSGPLRERLPAFPGLPATELPTAEAIPPARTPPPMVEASTPPSHSVEDRVGRLEQMMSEVLAAVKQGPQTASRSPASSYYAGASPRSPASSYYAAASQGQTLPTIAVLSQLEGNALAQAVGALESQVQAKREALQRLTNEVRRMEQLIRALQQMDGGSNGSSRTPAPTPAP
jgi:beta-lactamase regulating signal transducer with metallopeptidase domain